MTIYGVTLLSGGLDSTTVTTLAKEEVDDLQAITFHYGQTHSKEVECAVNIADHLAISHHLLDISFLGDIAWYSALTNPEMFPIPKQRPTDQIGFGIPITYVPLRNTIFISLAGAFLESNILKAIESDSENPNNISARIYMAPNAIDYSGYPDCRPEFYSKVKETLNEGSKMSLEYGVKFEIHTPIINSSKSDIAKLADNIGAPINMTWSCYEGGPLPCGNCDSCILRSNGYREAGLDDPLLTNAQ